MNSASAPPPTSVPALSAISRVPLALGSPTPAVITSQVSRLIGWRSARTWWLLLAFALSLVALLVGTLGDLVQTGIGRWGNDQTVGWAWDITGFVFWIGIGHAGTLISAILFLLRQKWRTSIHRAAEAMTIFAVLTAAIYPVFHMGRVWLVYWLFPLPNQMGVWPNFASPLLWDVFAISTYAIVSVVFWYIGLVPDLSTLRDRATTRTGRIACSILSLGWRGSHRHWVHYEAAYLVLAGLSTPLVLSVHTIVSFDFAASVVPGWHTTIFPPYFVVGAVLSGFAMLVLLVSVLRTSLGLQNLITLRHLENMNKVVLATACMMGYAYGVEVFMAWYGGQPYERYAFANRAFGPYAWAYWTMVGCNVLIPQAFWFRAARRSVSAMRSVALLVLLGMWLERFVIVVTSLHRDFLPSSWTHFAPRLSDVTTFVGTLGLFFSLFLVFVRFVPVVAMSEIKAALAEAERHRAEEEPALADAGNEAEPNRDFRVHAGSMLQEVGRSGLAVGWFGSPDDLRRACRSLQGGGFRVDAHTPYPVHGLEAIESKRSWVPRAALASGIVGALVAIGLQVWAQGFDYPQNIAGKPAIAWQAYVPVTFELAVLFAALGAVAALFVACRLPNLEHPVMNHPDFAGATDDRYFISVEAIEGAVGRAGAVLISLGARDVTEVAT